MGGAPEPKILMQEVERYDCDDKEASFHVSLKVFLQVARDLTHGKLLTIVQETIWEDNIRRTKQKTLIVFSNEVFQILG
jgi:hypothetical protein